MADDFSSNPFKGVFDLLDGFEKKTAPYYASFERKIDDLIRGIRKVQKTVEEGVVTLEADVPGMKKKDIVVSLKDYGALGTKLIVEGKRGERQLKISFVFQERVDASEAKAELSAGVLKVTVPVAPEPTDDITVVKIS